MQRTDRRVSVAIANNFLASVFNDSVPSYISELDDQQDETGEMFPTVRKDWLHRLAEPECAQVYGP